MNIKLELKKTQLESFVEILVGDINEYYIIGLEGELGSGKTTFVKSLVKKLGILEEVSSPTYSIENTYVSTRESLLVRHVDLYRGVGLEQEQDFLNRESNFRTELLVIEWFNLVKTPNIEPNLLINFDFNAKRISELGIDDSVRQVTINGGGNVIESLKRTFLLKN